MHIHTVASDGRWTVEQILRRAVERGMAAVAITDHDTVDGLTDLSNTQTCFPMEVIPGIELNTDADNRELHILGYFIDTRNGKLNKTLGELRDARTERIKTMVKKLTKLGYDLNFDEVKKQAGVSKALGRPHIAAALIEKGYYATSNDVFHGPIAKGGPAYVPHYKLTPFKAVETILEAGGLPVLAHPGLIGDDSWLHLLVAHGLAGIEVYHPKHDKATTNHYNQLARNFHLVVTGGSDFHGIPGRFPQDLGEFGIPCHLVHCLNERHHARI